MLSFLVTTFRNNKAFFVPYAIFLGTAISWVLLMPHGSFYLEVNEAHNSIFDAIMPYATYLGDGLFVTAVTVILLFVRFGHALLLLASGILTSLIVQTTKRILNLPRPTKYFHDLDLHLIDGVDVHSALSFPSGHSTTAFLTFAALMFVVKRGNDLAIVFFVFALAAAFSRIYLSQHFLIDILVGSVIGVGSVIFVAFIFEKYLPPSKYPWTKMSILNRS